MKLYGYKFQEPPIEDIEIDELSDVTLAAKPDELRRIARFLEVAADEMERMGKDYSHEHLSDRDASFIDSPQLIVFNPVASE
jgi:hypothetical protein